MTFGAHVLSIKAACRESSLAAVAWAVIAPTESAELFIVAKILARLDGAGSITLLTPEPPGLHRGAAASEEVEPSKERRLIVRGRRLAPGRILLRRGELTVAELECGQGSEILAAPIAGSGKATISATNGDWFAATGVDSPESRRWAKLPKCGVVAALNGVEQVTLFHKASAVCVETWTIAMIYRATLKRFASTLPRFVQLSLTTLREANEIETASAPVSGAATITSEVPLAEIRARQAGLKGGLPFGAAAAAPPQAPAMPPKPPVASLNTPPAPRLPTGTGFNPKLAVTQNSEDTRSAVHEAALPFKAGPVSPPAATEPEPRAAPAFQDEETQYHPEAAPVSAPLPFAGRPKPVEPAMLAGQAQVAPPARLQPVIPLSPATPQSPYGPPALVPPTSGPPAMVAPVPSPPETVVVSPPQMVAAPPIIATLVDGPSAFGPSALGPSALGPSALGPSALGPSGPSALGPSSLGPSALGSSAPATSGPSVLGASALGALGSSALGASGPSALPTRTPETPSVQSVMGQSTAEPPVMMPEPALAQAPKPAPPPTPGAAPPQKPNGPRPALVVELERRLQSGESLTGLDLRGGDLTGAVLPRARLIGIDLSNATLSYADLTGAQLSQANLDGAVLEHAKLDGATLTRASLGGANLTGASLNNVQGRECQAAKANFSNTNLEGSDFRRARLNGAELQNARGTGMSARECDFTECNLSGANLERAMLRNCILNGATITDAIFAQADLRNADIRGITPEAALQGANLAGARRT